KSSMERSCPIVGSIWSVAARKRSVTLDPHGVGLAAGTGAVDERIRDLLEEVPLALPLRRQCPWPANRLHQQEGGGGVGQPLHVHIHGVVVVDQRRHLAPPVDADGVAV